LDLLITTEKAAPANVLIVGGSSSMLPKLKHIHIISADVSIHQRVLRAGSLFPQAMSHRSDSVALQHISAK
jgi:hypothetical protein